MMHGHEKSDFAIVAVKPTNKAEHSATEQSAAEPTAAEPVEPRAETKRNAGQQSTCGTQGQVSVSQALERIRRVAKERKKEKFTSLLHHISIDLLDEAFFELKEEAAPGVDGLTWTEYEQNLDRNIEDLHARVHRGAYRALPSRRVYIPKPDGRQRPLAVAALEDKIVQRATAAVLNAIYEEDFLGFSYGFRPGRGTHDALNALCVAIERKKVNWILDADIRSFFDDSLCSLIEEVGLRADDLEAQAFFASASDMKRFDLAALDTLPHCLSRNSQQTHGLIHGEEVIWCFFSDTGAQVVGETNTPRGPWCQLFSGDDALVEPAMNG